MGMGKLWEQIESPQSSMVAPKQNENQFSTLQHAGWASWEDMFGWVIKITWWSETLFRMCGPLWPRACAPAGCEELNFECGLTQRLFVGSWRSDNHNLHILSTYYVPITELSTGRVRIKSPHCDEANYTPLIKSKSFEVMQTTICFTVDKSVNLPKPQYPNL